MTDKIPDDWQEAYAESQGLPPCLNPEPHVPHPLDWIECLGMDEERIYPPRFRYLASSPGGSGKISTSLQAAMASQSAGVTVMVTHYLVD